MGCCNEPVSTLTGVPPDPSQHVNYARGMVLGVDDFVQEFAYLAGATHWLARETVGYGTVTGLHVRVEDDGTDGPRLHVSAGSALLPNGRLVCVAADQCAVLNRWLAKPENAAVVTRLLNPSSPTMSPPVAPAPGDNGFVTLYLTLSAAECLTRPVPIPGEPCRSEDELMAPSRVADDYKLELRDTAPSQVEEDALRDFVRWLRGSVLAGAGGPSPAAPEAAWVAALRKAAQPWLAAQVASPPLSPPASVATLGDYLFDTSPPTLQVATGDLSDFLRVAFRLWVTELRPMWTALRGHQPQQPDTSSVLLAQVRLNVTWVGGPSGGVWQVTGNASTVAIDETTRPYLTHLRLLQEWLLTSSEVAGVAAGGTGLATPPTDGQLLIGSAGGYALGKLQGTSNQVNVTSAAGSITLATPQDIATTSKPAFAGLSTTGSVHIAVTRVTNELQLDDRHHFVLCDGDVRLALPKPEPLNAGRIYIVKCINGRVELLAEPVASLDDPTATPGTLKAGNTKTLVSDGDSAWHVISSLA